MNIPLYWFVFRSDILGQTIGAVFKVGIFKKRRWNRKVVQKRGNKLISSAVKHPRKSMTLFSFWPNAEMTHYQVVTTAEGVKT
jgi:hypothetical protein